jgi:hypothetical protein
MSVLRIQNPATTDQIHSMLEELQTYIKLAGDVERNILAGGGEYHADCEEVLLEEGSDQDNLWGADWHPDSKTIEFGALINIRPRQNNRGMEIEDPHLRNKVETVVRHLLGTGSR